MILKSLIFYEQICFLTISSGKTHEKHTLLKISKEFSCHNISNSELKLSFLYKWTNNIETSSRSKNSSSYLLNSHIVNKPNFVVLSNSPILANKNFKNKFIIVTLLKFLLEMIGFYYWTFDWRLKRSVWYLSLEWIFCKIKKTHYIF